MLIFQTPTSIPIEAFTTFGINVKLSSNPIGHFGTGLKYAVAVTLRLGGSIRLFKGETEYNFYTSEASFRDKTFFFVKMRKRKGLAARWRYTSLPYTTELGKDWKPWMAFRELASNTKDEDGIWFSSSEPPKGKINQTLIILDCPEIENDNLDAFLPDNLSLLYENNNVQIFEKPSHYIYYRGIRVTDLAKPSLFTYNRKDDFILTEDRTDGSQWNTNWNIRTALLSSDDATIYDSLLGMNEDCYEANLDFDSEYATPTDKFRDILSTRIGSGLSIPKRLSSMYERVRQRLPQPTDELEVTLQRKHLQTIINADLNHEITSRCQDALS